MDQEQFCEATQKVTDILGVDTMSVPMTTIGQAVAEVDLSEVIHATIQMMLGKIYGVGIDDAETYHEVVSSLLTAAAATGRWSLETGYVLEKLNAQSPQTKN